MIARAPWTAREWHNRGVPADDPGRRVWRARKRLDRMDATIARAHPGWTLQIFRNDRCLLTWRYETRALARDEADRRLRDLQRAGWTAHW